MPQQVVAGAQMKCSFGDAPSVLALLPANQPIVGGSPAATIMDHLPMVNIPMFAMCKAPTNPAVVAATAAALGVPTPAPCVPVILAPWAPGSTKLLISGIPALNDACLCNCAYGGVINIDDAGQATTTVP